MGNELDASHLHLCFNLYRRGLLFMAHLEDEQCLAQFARASNWFYFVDFIFEISPQDLGKEQIIQKTPREGEIFVIGWIILRFRR